MTGRGRTRGWGVAVTTPRRKAMERYHIPRFARPRQFPPAVLEVPGRVLGGLRSG